MCLIQLGIALLSIAQYGTKDFGMHTILMVIALVVMRGQLLLASDLKALAEAIHDMHDGMLVTQDRVCLIIRESTDCNDALRKVANPYERPDQRMSHFMSHRSEDVVVLPSDMVLNALLSRLHNIDLPGKKW